MVWKQGNLEATVNFKDGRAEVIRYMLPTFNWSDAQISAALQANGNGWKLVPTSPGAGTAIPAMMHAVGWLGSANRWLSAEGNDAVLSGSIMTISAADLVQAKDEKAAALQRGRTEVPHF